MDAVFSIMPQFPSVFQGAAGIFSQKAAPPASKHTPLGPAKSLAEFAARRRQRSKIIFSCDMCVRENTSQAASVEFVRLWHTNYARSRLQAFCRKNRRVDRQSQAAGGHFLLPLFGYALFRRLQRCLHKAPEQGVRPVGTALELRVELRPHEPAVGRLLHDLHQAAVRGQA